jgi:hypothetical protein
MSFDASLEPAWSGGIYPGARDCECDPIRVDRVHHNEKICDKIVAEMECSPIR